MKLKELVITQIADYSGKLDLQGNYPQKLFGSVTFTSDNNVGTLKFDLTKDDFDGIQQLLMAKCKEFAGNF